MRPKNQDCKHHGMIIKAILTANFNNRTMMDTTRTVGNDVLFRRVANDQRLPTTNQAPGLTLTNPRTINETKMHASTGPIQTNFNGSSKFICIK